MGKESQRLGGTRGAVSTEYVIVVGAVGLLFMAAMVAIGPGLVESYDITRSVVASPFP
ncbi:MAG: hypothetical protein RIF41_13325 [Polyangiaceae bacterium]